MPFLPTWFLICILLLHLLDYSNLVVSSVSLHRRITAHLPQQPGTKLGTWLSVCSFDANDVGPLSYTSVLSIGITWTKAQGGQEPQVRSIQNPWTKKACPARPMVLRPGFILESLKDHAWTPTDQRHQFLGWGLSSVFLYVPCAVCVHLVFFFLKYF